MLGIINGKLTIGKVKL